MAPPSSILERRRLTEAEKKENHIKSEQRRREAIREGYDRLASIVPGMQGQGRSEALVLEATLRYIREQIEERQTLIFEAQARGVDTTGWELPKETLEACEAQLKRNMLEAQQK